MFEGASTILESHLHILRHISTLRFFWGLIYIQKIYELMWSIWQISQACLLRQTSTYLRDIRTLRFFGYQCTLFNALHIFEVKNHVWVNVQHLTYFLRMLVLF